MTTRSANRAPPEDALRTDGAVELEQNYGGWRGKKDSDDSQRQREARQYHDRLQRYETRIGNCNSVWGILARERTDPDGTRWIDRTALPLRCGHRACPTCGEAARGKAAARMFAAWKTTITLTLPHQLTRAEQWRSVGRWVSRWCHALVKWLRRHRPGSPVEYAWVLESHYSGYPHVHVVLEYDCRGSRTQWQEFARWIRSAWRSITGLSVRWVRVEPVRTSAEKLKNYLLKYLTKASYDLSHYAMIGRRRMWATSLPAVPIEPKGWVLETIQTHDLVEPNLVEPIESTPLAHDGWHIVWRGERSYYATRPVQDPRNTWPDWLLPQLDNPTYFA